MELVRTTADIKKYANVLASFKPETLENSANDVRELVIDILGITEYTNLVAAYGGSTDTTTNAQKALLPYAQRALICLAMSEHYSSGLTEVSDAGIHLSTSKDRKNIPADLRKENMRKYLRKGYDALQSMLIFLHGSGNTYTHWIASEQRKTRLSLFVNNAIAFSKGYNIDNNFIVFDAMRDSIASVEQKYIEPILGKNLTTSLRASILARTPTDNQKLLIDKIIMALAPLAIVDAIPNHLSKFTENGIIQNADSVILKVDSFGTPTDSAISLRISAAQSKGHIALNQLQSYLEENAAIYTEYVPIGSNKVVINKKSNKTFRAI